jgi:hypothetical protein
VNTIWGKSVPFSLPRHHPKAIGLRGAGSEAEESEKVSGTESEKVSGTVY